MATLLNFLSFLFLACNVSFSHARQVSGLTNIALKQEGDSELASRKENIDAAPQNWVLEKLRATRMSRKEMKEDTIISSSSSASASAAALTNRSKPQQDIMRRNWKLQDMNSYVMALSTADYRTPTSHPPKNN